MTGRIAHSRRSWIPASWKALSTTEPREGVLTFYLSSSAARVPTRAVDRYMDHKRDPNFETMTYGLFTDCNRVMRTACVRDGRRYLFFMTSWKGKRCVTGFMEIGWVAEITLNEKLERGFALKAKQLHLVVPPLPFLGRGPAVKFGARAVGARGIAGSGPLRGASKLDAETTAALIAALQTRRRATASYIRELHRLEEGNLKEYGYRYPDVHRLKPFTEDDVERYLF